MAAKAVKKTTSLTAKKSSASSSRTGVTSAKKTTSKSSIPPKVVAPVSAARTIALAQPPRDTYVSQQQIPAAYGTPLRSQSPQIVQQPSSVQGAINNPPLERPGLRGAVGEREQKVLPPKPRGRSSFTIWRSVFATILFAFVVGVAAWYFFSSNLTAEQKREEYVNGIVAKIAKLALIPPSETPTIGVIPDPSRIQENKEFFKNASQGDYLVVFPNARLMLIYSPSRNIIINMGYAEGGVAGSAAEPAAGSTKGE